MNMENQFGLPSVSKHARPFPAIVIAVGTSTIELTRQVQRIYLRGDTRRTMAVAFYQLLPDEASKPILSELDAAYPAAPQQETASEYLVSRRKALLAAISEANQIKPKLESILHEQRTQERLVSTGWGDKYEIPLNVFILGDMKDPWTAGILLPLTAILNEVFATTRLCRAHLLLDVAVFPEHITDQDLSVWSTLQALDDYLQVKSRPREKLAQFLKMQTGSAPDFAIYLFDCRKEGSAVLKDQASLNIHIGNALLALLQEDVAGQLLNGRDQNSIYERQSFYASLGSSVLLYDPNALQMACAGRSGYAFIENKILAEPSDGQAAIRHAHTIQEKIGGLYNWLEQMCKRLAPSIGQVSIQSDLSEILPQFTDLILPPLDYERLDQTPWAVNIRQYYENFRKLILGQVCQQLASNQADLVDQLDNEVKEAFDHLPLDEELYPGGVQNSRLVLQVLLDSLGKTASDLQTHQKHLPDDLSAAEAKFTNHCAELERLVSSLPKIPWWARIMPAFIRQWLALLLATLFHGHKIMLVDALRGECIMLLQRLCGLHIKKQAFDSLVALPQHIEGQIHSTKTDLDVLETKLIKAKARFSPEWGAFPLGIVENGWDPLFRRLTNGRELAEWAYTKWMPDFNTWLQDFLTPSQLFVNWRTVEDKDIVTWIENHAVLAYQNLWNLSLDAIFDLWSKGSADFPAEKSQASSIIRECMLVAIPPARPNFDAVGGSHGAAVSFRFVTGDVDWQYCALPAQRNGIERWTVMQGGDPYLAIFIQTHNNFPLKALVDSFQDAWRRLEALPEPQRQAYDLLRGLDHPPTPILETTDPSNPDLVQKIFRWKFQPRGSANEIEQEITLYLSRSRYENYHRQTRLSSEWNRYAEAEMPEVRMLAAEFQKLHTQYKWSTFNQAYNVLKFVQACIRYSYDEDSTGYLEWPRYPIETLMEGTGDCEDVAILCAAVIARLGFQVVLLDFPGHVAFGVAGAEKLKGEYIHDPATGRYYFYGEATADGWHLGQIPKTHPESTLEQILPVNILIEEEPESV